MTSPAGSKTLSFRARANAHGALHLDIAVESPDTEYDLVVVVQPMGAGAVQLSPVTFVLAAEVENEEGRWFAEIPDVPGAFAHASSREQAINRATAVALHDLADRLEVSQEAE